MDPHGQEQNFKETCKLQCFRQLTVRVLLQKVLYIGWTSCIKFVPESFRFGIIQPVPKNKMVTCQIDMYRGTTLTVSPISFLNCLNQY